MKQISTHITEDQLRRLDALGATTGLKPRTAIRLAVDQYLLREEERISREGQPKKGKERK